MNCFYTNSEEAYALVGDPVNVITGANVDRSLDFQLLGAIPIRWVRHYDSAQCRKRYSLGWGHTQGFDRQLILDTDGLRYVGPLGAAIGFPPLTMDGQRFTMAATTLQRVNERLYRIYQTDSPVMEFDYRDQLVIPLSRFVQGDAFVSFHYDGNGRLEELRDSSSRRIYISYNADGCMTKLVLIGEVAQASRTLLTYRYDAAGNLVWASDQYSNDFTFGYDGSNRMISRTDRRGYSFLFEYDAQGRCIRSTGEDGLLDTRLQYLVQEEVTIVTKADGGNWTYLHPEGKLIRIIDPHGGSREFVRDPAGKLLEEIDENQNVSKIVYGKGGARLGKLSSLGVFSADGDGLPPASAPHLMPESPLEWEWGHLLDRRQIVLPDSGDAVTDQCGPAAKLVQTADQPQTPQQKFDEFGLLIHESHLRGAPRRWVYDVNGNTQRYHDHDGRQFNFEYSSWNLLTRKLNPLGQSITYEYTPFEQIAAIVDAGNTRTEYGYDLKERLTEVRRHGVVRERYQYDLAGNLVEKFDADHLSLLSFEIGPNNLKKTRTLASGDVHSFTYTAKGQFASASTNESTTEFSYNQFSNRTRDERNGRGVEHTFAGPGKLKLTVVFKNFQTAYNLLPSGTLVIIDPAGNRHSVRKLENSLIQRTFSSRTSELAQYDPDGRCLLKAVFLKGSQSELWSRSYKYSGEGDLLCVEDNRRGTTQYEYDAAHRIAIVQTQRGTLSHQSKFLFDAAGNLLQQPGLSEVTLLDGNRLLTANGDRFEYNNRNHIFLRMGRTGTTKYFYDSRDMLVRCEMPDGEWAANYDPLGRRISKTFGERKTEFFWDTDRLIAELNGDGRLRIYVYADAVALVPLLFVDYDSPESDPATGRVYSVFANHLGSPVRVEDNRGDAVWETEYDPYGLAHIDRRSTIEFNLRYPGHYYDQELGLHYNRFRYYSPELGRYLQSDPVGLAGGINVYAYTSNPLNSVDLRGTSCPNGGKPTTGDDQDPGDEDDGADKEAAQGAGTAAGKAPVPLEDAEAVVAKALNDAPPDGVGLGGVKLFQVATHEDGTVSVGLSGSEKSVQSAINRTTLPDGYSMGAAKTNLPPLDPRPTNSDGSPYQGDSSTCAEPRLQSAIAANDSPVAQKGSPVWRGDPDDNPYPASQPDGTSDPSRMDPCPSCKARNF